MILAIIQARMGSSRLPGKIMMDICGKPVLWHLIERLKVSRKVDDIVIATSVEKENDVVRDFCIENGLKCYSGSETDVLDRFYQAATGLDLSDQDVIIRITADCPLIDYEVLDDVISCFQEKAVDYVSNSLIPTFPDGLDCEVFRFEILKYMWENAKMASEREHVTLFIRNHPESFSVFVYKNKNDLSHLRWTLDEKEDYDLIKMIYTKLYHKKKYFLMGDIMELYKEEPELMEINRKYMRNEGLIKSLENDSEIKQL